MWNIIKASLYKLIKDRPFKVTMIVGAVLAVAFSLLYAFMIPDLGSGYFMLLSSSSPTSNFGIAVPINLVTFIIGEFNYGTIRNKIIAGNKRVNIYIALLVMGIIFSVSLMAIYIGLGTLLTTLLCGFNPQGTTVGTDSVLWTIFYTLVIYITLSALSVFTASAIRHIGGAITVTILIIVGGLVASIIVLTNMITTSGSISIPDYIYIINPIFITSVTQQLFGMGTAFISNLNKAMMLSILSNVIYCSIFVSLGIVIFNYRDVK